MSLLADDMIETKSDQKKTPPRTELRKVTGHKVKTQNHLICIPAMNN